MNARDPSEALRHLESAERIDLALPGIAFNGFFGALYPVYPRGIASLAANRPLEAITEFQRIVDHPGIVLGDPVGAMARLQLARAFTRSGETGKAKAAYEDVLALWKDADPDMLMFARASVEYATLR